MGAIVKHMHVLRLNLQRMDCTVIPRYTSNQFTSFRLHKMHKLVTGFQFTSQFSLVRASSSRKPIVVQFGKQWETNFRFSSFRLTSSFGGTN
jgi:hypothetical protein